MLTVLRNRSIAGALFLTLILALPCWAKPPTSAVKVRASYKLSRRDAEKLRLGEMIFREHKSEAIFGGTAFAVLPHPIWRLWQVITDFPEYPEFYPRNLAAEVLADAPGRILLKTRLQAGGQFPEVWNESEIRFYVPKKKTSLLMMTWEAKKSNLKANYGFWLLERRGTQTYVIHQTNFLLDGLPRSLVQKSAMATLRRNLEAINDRGDNPRYTRYPNQVRFAWK